MLSPYLDGQIQLKHSRMSLCEKWMIAISSVQDAEEKLRSMQFMADCPALIEELQSGEYLGSVVMQSCANSIYKSFILSHLTNPKLNLTSAFVLL